MPLRGISSRSAGLAAAAVLLLAVTALLLVHVHAAGPEMDEGLALAYPDRIVAGDVPYRDFETVYGPANPFAVAGAFAVAGVGLPTERAVGLLYRLLLAASVLAIARRFGVASLVSAGLLLCLVLPGTGIWAWAGYGAVGFGATALAAGLEGLVRPAGRARNVLFAAAGAAAGLTALMRFDYAPAAVLSALPLLLGAGAAARRRWTLAFLAAVLPYLPLALLAGPGRIEELARHIAASASGRHLPLPPLGFFPANILAAAATAAVALAAGGALLARRGGDPRPRALAAAGLFALATLPHALSRADGEHVVLNALLPLPLLPALLAEGARRLDERVTGPASRTLVTGTTAVAAVLLATYLFSPRSKAELSPLTSLDDVHGAPVRHAGREFRLKGADVAVDARLAVDAAARLTPKARTLFVGPQDLRRLNYADTFFYYLLPELRPAGPHLELAPGWPRGTSVPLLRELGRADVLLLDSRFDRAFERNTSAELGSPAPNRFVASHFCPRAEHGPFAVLERCPVHTPAKPPFALGR